MRMDCQGGWGEAGLGGLGLHTQEPGGRREILLVGGVHLRLHGCRVHDLQALRFGES